jgi:hypothetical protein
MIDSYFGLCFSPLSNYEQAKLTGMIMKKILVYLSTGALLPLALFLVGCDWESGSGDNNFNLSGGSSNINISGFYRGTLQGRAVDRTSNGNINFLTIQQSGNRVEITDNQGSKYVGTVGAPNLLIPEGADSVPNGATLATYQISFSGKDNVAARDIEFSGTINIVSVSDINGATSSSTRDRVNGSETTGTFTSLVTNIVDGVEVVTNTTTTTTDNDTTTRENTTQYDFTLTEQTTQLRLRGTWVEVGGVVSGVDAVASGVQGNITTTTTTPTP